MTTSSRPLPAFAFDVADVPEGRGLCVCEHLGIVVVNCKSEALAVYALRDLRLLRHVNCGPIRGFSTGLSATPRSSVLIAEYYSEQVREVDVVDGSTIRVVGARLGMKAQGVHATAAVIAVADEADAVWLFDWSSGTLLWSVVASGPGDGCLSCPRGVAVTRDGTAVLVADFWNHRVRLLLLHFSGR